MRAIPTVWSSGASYFLLMMLLVPGGSPHVMAAETELRVPKQFEQRIQQLRENAASIPDRPLPESWRAAALKRAETTGRPGSEVVSEFEQRFQRTALSAHSASRNPNGDPTPVITVGDDPACDFLATGTNNGLQQAMDAAAIDANGSDFTEIRVANSGDYQGRRYFLNDAVGGDQSVSIIGGYLLCSSATPVTFTVLDAAGAGGGPVITIDDAASTELIDFSNLGLINGTPGAGDGGGMLIGAKNFVVGLSLSISFNNANNGGGVAIDAPAGDALLWLLDGSAISLNTATDGGGIYCTGGDSVVALDTNVVVSGNTSTNSGGGIYSSQCDIFSFASFPNGIFQNEAGLDGGGAYIASGGSFTMIGGEGGFGFGSTDSVGSLDNNMADRSGGGLFVINADSSATITDSQVSVNMADANDDDSGEGGGIRLNAGTSLTMDRTLPGRSCGSPVRCSQISLNTAQGGGGVYASGNGVSVDIRQTYITGNEADGNAPAVLINNGGGDLAQPGTLYMEGNIIANNPTFLTDGTGIQGTVDLQSNTQSTIANTTFANNLTGSFGRSIIIFNNANVRLLTSIVWESTGEVFNATWDADTTGQVDCAILHETSNLPGLTFGILTADPLFLDPGNGDYHLTLASPAVDFCDTFSFEPMENDIDGDVRGRDLVEIPNNLGPIDLGADEFTDILFYSGYEF